jgi:hypothetical protein
MEPCLLFNLPNELVQAIYQYCDLLSLDRLRSVSRRSKDNAKPIINNKFKAVGQRVVEEMQRLKETNRGDESWPFITAMKTVCLEDVGAILYFRKLVPKHAPTYKMGYVFEIGYVLYRITEGKPEEVPLDLIPLILEKEELWSLLLPMERRLRDFFYFRDSNSNTYLRSMATAHPNGVSLIEDFYHRAIYNSKCHRLYFHLRKREIIASAHVYATIKHERGIEYDAGNPSHIKLFKELKLQFFDKVTEIR